MIDAQAAEAVRLVQRQASPAEAEDTWSSGVLESAYIVDRSDLYLGKSVFERVGALEEILS